MAQALRLSETPSPDTVISCRGLSHSYGDLPVLKDISFDVRQGEFLAIVGPSGCGKSTLLRILAGLLKPSGGQVQVAGPGGRPAQVGFVFQEAVLMPWRTVLGNVLLPFEVGQEDLRQGRERAQAALELVGLSKFRRSYPSQLSRGMRQRVAIARVLARDCDIILMDESFASLDALARERLNVEIRHIWRQTGKTILFVTHSISEAVFVSERVLVLSPRPGRIEQAVPVDLPAERGLEALSDSRTAQLTGQIREIMQHPSAHQEPETWEPIETFWSRHFQYLLVPVVFVLFLLLWQALKELGSYDRYILPGPLEVWQKLGDCLSRRCVGGRKLLAYGLVTVRSSLSGFALGLGAAALFGYALAKMRALERALSPYIVAFQAMPIVALAPLVLLWFGSGFVASTLVSALIAFFPMLVNTIVGIRETDRRLRDLMLSLKASRWQIFRKLEVPGALPVLFGGMRIGITLSLIGAVVGEFATGSGGLEGGLGTLVNLARINLKTPELFVALLALAALGVTYYTAITVLENFILSWKRKS